MPPHVYTVSHDRRNDYDVTNSVQVSSAPAVRNAVYELFAETWPGASFDRLWLAFYDFQRLFSGRYPGYIGCDTTYHDLQHSLDMTLALARLVAGYERSVDASERLGPHRALLSVIISLFHDAGYIRHVERDRDFTNGAEFTMQHVSRSADFLQRYLPTIGMTRDVGVASKMVHFTGYEIDLDSIELDDPRDVIGGHLIGTADLLAQMADRCYLEKCRDRLYKEFVVGGLAVENAKPGEYMIRYESGQHLLEKTPMFYQQVMRERLNNKFNKCYRYVEVLFDGHNPYIEAITNNITHLVKVISTGNWSLLRRQPPYFVSVENADKDIDTLVTRQLERPIFEAKNVEAKNVANA
ncbi:MAG TPA: hypothetical protein VFY03_08535 [Woeseiaceae bacterium]|nr:hypothetical protein [Woeseiaceae bacterium]